MCIHHKPTALRVTIQPMCKSKDDCQLQKSFTSLSALEISTIDFLDQDFIVINQLLSCSNFLTCDLRPMTLSAQKPGESAQQAHTRRKSCYTPKASPRGERLPPLPPLLCWFNSPPTTNVGLIPTISPVTHWCPLALTGPTPQFTSDRLHT